VGGAIVAVAIVAAAILPYSIYYTSRHVGGLLIVIVLIEAVAASYFAGNSDQKIGAIIRYPLNLLFVLPFIPALWKSGILREGGFRDCAIYLTWALFSVSYSILPTVSLARALAAILVFLALCAIASEVRSENDARRFMGVLLAACGIVVAANFLYILINPGLAWQPDTESGMLRFDGFLTEPNEIGNLTLATVCAGYGYWPVAKGWKKGLAATAMLGSVVQGVMADSRSPLIGIAIGCVVYLILKYRAKGVIGVVALYLVFMQSRTRFPACTSTSIAATSRVSPGGRLHGILEFAASRRARCWDMAMRSRARSSPVHTSRDGTRSGAWAISRRCTTGIFRAR